MKKKFTMYSIENYDNINHYTFEKTQNAFETLSKIFRQVFKIPWKLFDFVYDDEPEDGKDIKILVKNITDEHHRYENGMEKRVDVFYGKNKMFVIFSCSNKIREKINEELGKVTKMPKQKKLPKQKKSKRNKTK